MSEGSPYLEATRAAERLCLAASPLPDDAPHLAVYRPMVRARFRDVLVASAPRFARAAGPDAVDAWLSRWLATDGPRTRWFWELPLSAEGSATALRASGAIAAWQHALLRFELATWRVRHATFPADPPWVPLTFEAAPVVTQAHALLTLDHPVADTATDPETTRLVIFRRADDSVGVRTLNRVAALVLEALATPGDATLEARMRALVVVQGLAGGPSFAVALGEMLAEWLDDRLLLGSRA